VVGGIVEHGSLGGLAQLAIIMGSGFCASCVPLSLQYYVPSAEGAKVRSYSCSGNPPYEAYFLGGGVPVKHDVMISLSQQSLARIKEPTITLIINPFHRTLIDVDPTLIQIKADGQLLQPASITYYLGRPAGGPHFESHGPIHIETDYLIIYLPLGAEGASDVVTHLSPIVLDGEVIELPDVSFKLERHTVMYNLAINC
jgi:hypothetical protein